MDADLTRLIEIFEEHIPFTRLLGFKVDSIEDNTVRVHIPYTPDLIGDKRRNALHGGVLGSVADAAGGLAVMAQTGSKSKVSTVDMRIDYLRPGQPQTMYCDAKIERLGQSVASVSMSVFHDPDTPVALGRAVYNISYRTDQPASDSQ